MQQYPTNNTFLDFRDFEEEQPRRRAFSAFNMAPLADPNEAPVQSTRTNSLQVRRSVKRSSIVSNSSLTNVPEDEELPVGTYYASPAPSSVPTAPSTAPSGVDPEVRALLSEFSRTVSSQPREMTLMVRNVPNRYTQRMFLAEIRRSGFDRTFDFIYMPMDYRTRNNMGYCFLNFTDFAFARQFVDEYEGRRLEAFKSQKTLAIQPANTQGLFGNMKSFQSCEKEVPPEFQPIIFDHASGLEIHRETQFASRADPYNVWDKKANHGSMAMLSTAAGTEAYYGRV
jgi:hypothetical protein